MKQRLISSGQRQTPPKKKTMANKSRQTVKRGRKMVGNGGQMQDKLNQQQKKGGKTMDKRQRWKNCRQMENKKLIVRCGRMAEKGRQRVDKQQSAKKQ